MLRRLNKKGQNTLEYVLLIAAVAAAFLAIQWYLNRSVQGKIRDSADSIADQFDAKVGKYSSTTEDVTHTTTRDATEYRETKYIAGDASIVDVPIEAGDRPGWSKQSGYKIQIGEKAE